MIFSQKRCDAVIRGMRMCGLYDFTLKDTLMCRASSIASRKGWLHRRSRNTKETRSKTPYCGNYMKRANMLEIQINVYNIMRIPYYQKRKSHIYTALSREPRVIGLIPKEMITFKMIKRSVDDDPRCIRYLSEEMLTECLLEYLTRRSYHVLWHIPEHLLTEKLLLFAISNNYRSLGEIPEHLLTRRIIEHAIAQNSRAIKHIPECVITEEIALLHILYHPHRAYRLPKRFQKLQLHKE